MSALVVALIAIGVSIPAFAADMPVKAPPPPAPTAPYNWSGLYVDANFGGAWTSGNLNIPGINFYGGLTEFISVGAPLFGLRTVRFTIAGVTRLTCNFAMVFALGV